MKQFFMKKYIFAPIFFIILAGLSLFTILFGFEDIKKEIQSIEPLDSISGISVFTQDAEVILSNRIWGKEYLIEMYGFINKALQKKEINAFSFVKDKNGYFYNATFYVAPNKKIPEYAKEVRQLKESLEQRGTKTLYINFPEKDFACEKIDFGLPIRRFDSEQNELLFLLMQNRVDSLDLRTSFTKMEAEKSKLYYKTDRRMTAYGSFLAFQAIVNEFQKRYAINLDSSGYYTDQTHYKKTIYPKSFLGGMGNEFGVSYSGLDDFEIYFPQKEDDYIWEYIDDEGNLISETGTLTQTILKKSRLFDWDNIYYNRMFDVFMGGDHGYDKIINKKISDAPKILCIRDDKFSSVAVFLAPLCSELHLISPVSDLMEIGEYIKENQFDYVLIAYSAGRIRDDYFDFLKD